MRSFFKTFSKAAITTGVSAVPIAIKQFAPPHWSPYLFVAYMLAVFAASLKIFEPDRRFLAIREPVIKVFLKVAMAQAPNITVRANVFVRRGVWPFYSLVPLISYNENTALADYGKRWPRGRGLCWEVYRRGKFSRYRKGIDSLSDLGMRKRDVEDTAHVEHVFCIPLRRKPKSGSEDGVSGKVSAVLAFDALSKEGAEFLETQHESFKSHENKVLTDLVQAISLFF